MVPVQIGWLVAGMGLLFSPDHLRLWGNLAGHVGSTFWVFTIAASTVFAVTVTSYRRLAACGENADGYLSALHAHAGLIGISLALASRLALTIGVSTGVLVTAGFTFNETFVYWFPNFAFAFAYLALVALFFLMGYKVAEKAMMVLLSIAVLGIVILVLSGWIGIDSASAPKAIPTSGFGLGAVSAGFLLFVGFDLGIHRIAHPRDAAAGTAAMLVVLGITVVLLSLWGAVSLVHVPANRLADSSIPYTLAARAIAGQTGRILMGLVVIAGAGCAVMALFLASARMAASLARLNMLPRICQGSPRRNAVVISILTSAVAAMMAAGFAGGPGLEIFIRAGLLLWLLHAVLVHLAASKAHDPNASADMAIRSRHTSWPMLLAAVLIGAGVINLWFTDADRVRLLTNMLAVWMAGMVLLLPAWSRKQRRQPPGRGRCAS